MHKNWLDIEQCILILRPILVTRSLITISTTNILFSVALKLVLQNVVVFLT